jgi:hypothetical protein
MTPCSLLVATQQTTRRHIPEDDTLYNHRCENLKSYVISTIFDFRFSPHRGVYEEYGLIRFDAVYFGESQTFRSNMSPPHSGTKSKPSKKPGEAGGIMQRYNPEYFTLHDFYILSLPFIKV